MCAPAVAMKISMMIGEYSKPSECEPNGPTSVFVDFASYSTYMTCHTRSNYFEHILAGGKGVNDGERDSVRDQYRIERITVSVDSLCTAHTCVKREAVTCIVHTCDGGAVHTAYALSTV